MVHGHGASTGHCAGQTVDEAVEFTCFARTDICSQTSTGKVEGVHDEQRTGTSETSRGQIGQKEGPEIVLGGVLGEEPFDGVFESEIEGLSGEISDDVGQISTPERGDTLLAGDAHEAVTDASVAGNLARSDLRVRILCLQQQFHALDGGDDGFREGTCGTTGSEIQHEAQGGFLFFGGGDEGGGGGRCGGDVGTHEACEASLLVET